MKIVIEIDKDRYEDTKRIASVQMNYRTPTIEQIVANGTPLPKGHGRLIDAEELKKIIRENDVLNMTGFNVRLCDINNTPTIIEADKESEE